MNKVEFRDSTERIVNIYNEVGFQLGFWYGYNSRICFSH